MREFCGSFSIVCVKKHVVLVCLESSKKDKTFHFYLQNPTCSFLWSNRLLFDILLLLPFLPALYTIISFDGFKYLGFSRFAAFHCSALGENLLKSFHKSGKRTNSSRPAIENIFTTRSEQKAHKINSNKPKSLSIRLHTYQCRLERRCRGDEGVGRLLADRIFRAER